MPRHIRSRAHAALLRRRKALTRRLKRAILKHRANGEVRRVPVCPELVVPIHRHLARFGTAPDGRIFVTAQGDIVSDSWHRRVGTFARTIALSEAQAASPLAQRPYELRHAAVSTWLNAGVPPTQVGHLNFVGVAAELGAYLRLSGHTAGPPTVTTHK